MNLRGPVKRPARFLCGKARGYLIAQRKRGGEPRAFDAEHAHKPVKPVRAWVVDHEIGLRLALDVKLRPHARVVGRERAIGQVGPEFADESVKAFRARGIDAVILGIDPFKIGPKARRPAQVAPIMGASAPGMGGG